MLPIAGLYLAVVLSFAGVHVFASSRRWRYPIAVAVVAAFVVGVLGVVVLGDPDASEFVPLHKNVITALIAFGIPLAGSATVLRIASSHITAQWPPMMLAVLAGLVASPVAIFLTLYWSCAAGLGCV